MEEIIKFYRSLIKAAFWQAREDGRIMTAWPGVDQMTLNIEHKTVVLPTMAQLGREDQETLMYFNPLKEDAFKPETADMAKFRRGIAVAMHMRTCNLIGKLADLAASPAEHNKLNPDQLGLMVDLKDINPTTVKDIVKVMATLRADDPERWIVRISLRKKAVLHGTTYSRGTIVSFPLYEALQAGGPIHGVKISEKCRKTLITLLKCIFPRIEEADAYSCGSQDTRAPALDSTLKTLKLLATDLNDSIELFSSACDGLDTWAIDMSWAEDLNFSKFEKALNLMPRPSMFEEAIPEQVQQQAARPATTQWQAHSPNQPQPAQPRPGAPLILTDLLYNQTRSQSNPLAAPGGGVQSALDNGLTGGYGGGYRGFGGGNFRA